MHVNGSLLLVGIQCFCITDLASKAMDEEELTTTVSCTGQKVAEGINSIESELTSYKSSGRMYYLNRKTLKRSWNRPKEQGVNLELNMSTTPMNVVVLDGNTGAAAATLSQAGTKRGTVVSSGENMIAVPCANCHLLVMLCKSSPSCPNCKFVQSLAPAAPQVANRRLDATVKPLQTLSLLH